MSENPKDIIAHNRYAWDWAANTGNPWTIPVEQAAIDRARRKDFDILLTPKTYIPKAWLGDVTGKKILGLASGGGQQGPLLAAAGADVTIVDLSPAQLQKEKDCNAAFELSIRTIESEAADLSMLNAGEFDIIINPVSNCFFPDLRPVWKECARVLKPGGTLIYGFINPVSYLFDFEKANAGEYILKYSSPYSDYGSLTEEERKRFLYPESPLEFGHSLTDQIALLLREGFVMEDFFEDIWGDGNKLDRHFPCFFGVKTLKT